MALSDYTTALATFAGAPTEANKATVLQYRLGLPDEVSSDGGVVKLPKIADLLAALDAAIAGASSTDNRRLIRVGLTHRRSSYGG